MSEAIVALLIIAISTLVSFAGVGLFALGRRS